MHIIAIITYSCSDSKFLCQVHIMFVPEEELGGMDGMRLFVHTDHFKELNLGFALDEGIG